MENTHTKESGVSPEQIGQAVKEAYWLYFSECIVPKFFYTNEQFRPFTYDRSLESLIAEINGKQRACDENANKIWEILSQELMDSLDSPLSTGQKILMLVRNKLDDVSYSHTDFVTLVYQIGEVVNANTTDEMKGKILAHISGNPYVAKLLLFLNEAWMAATSIQLNEQTEAGSYSEFANVVGGDVNPPYILSLFHSIGIQQGPVSLELLLDVYIDFIAQHKPKIVYPYYTQSLKDWLGNTREHVNFIAEAMQHLSQVTSMLLSLWGKYCIAHQDLKPSNIMLDADNRPVLIDFEAAKILLGDKWELLYVNGLNYLSQGTRMYLPRFALSELHGNNEDGEYKDLFALAMMVLEVFAPRTDDLYEKIVSYKESSMTDNNLAQDCRNAISSAINTTLGEEGTTFIADIILNTKSASETVIAGKKNPPYAEMLLNLISILNRASSASAAVAAYRTSDKTKMP